jgi:hypothetical protein
MFRLLLACVFVVMSMAAQAQTTKKAKMSPGEMAAYDQMVAEKRSDCQKQAKENKLGLTARRKYVKECVAKAVGN